VTEPLLPETTSDERDVGWGDDLSDDGSDDRLLADRPPHHDQE